MLFIFRLMIVNIQYFTFIEINIIIQKQILPYHYFPSLYFTTNVQDYSEYELKYYWYLWFLYIYKFFQMPLFSHCKLMKTHT